VAPAERPRRHLAELHPVDHGVRPLALLLALDGLEERAEVARAEALVPLALDDLEEERPRGRLPGEAGRVVEEDLEEVGAGRGAVHRDAEPPEHLHVLVDPLDPDVREALGQHVVAVAGRGHELHDPGAQPLHRRDDVLQVSAARWTPSPPISS
jgi:hypothetical protein